MDIYCTKCGYKNSNDNRFCESCGEKLTHLEQFNNAALDDETLNSSSEKNKRKLLIVGVIIGLLIMIGGLVVIFVYTASQKTAEYNDKISQADRYLEMMEYDKAETAYLEAIDINPKEEKPYLRVADIYIENKEYKKAEAILIKGEKKARSKKVKKALLKTKVFSEYEKLIEKGSNELAHVGESYNRGDYKGGLISALDEDINNDGISELITVSYGNSNSTELIISMYMYNGDGIELVNEESVAFDDESFYGVQYDVFLKKKDGNVYLCIKEYQVIYADMSLVGMKVYHIGADEIENVTDVAFCSAMGLIRFLVNDNTILEYVYETAFYDDSEYQATLDRGFTILDRELEFVDIICTREAEIKGGEISGYDESDDTQIHVCYVQHGMFDSYNACNLSMYNSVYLEDYTGIKNRFQ